MARKKTQAYTEVGCWRKIEMSPVTRSLQLLVGPDQGGTEGVGLGE